MGRLTGFLAQFARSGGLPPWLQPLGRLAGFTQILTTRQTATTFVALRDVTLPYAERSRLLGLGDFPLALDGVEHLAARWLIGAVIGDTNRAHLDGVALAAECAELQLGAVTGRRLEVAGELVEPALTTWIEHWFGLPGQGTNLLRAGRLIAHATFLNPVLPAGKVDLAGLRRCVEWIDGYRSALGDAMARAPQKTLAASVLAATGDDDLATSYVLGLTVGPLAFGTSAMVRAIDALLDTPWTADSIATDEDGREAFAVAVRQRPPLPGVLRDNPRPRELAGDGGSIHVGKGRVLVHTECAARIEGAKPVPLDASSAGGTSLPDLPFGIGMHACLGRSQITDVAGPVLRRLGDRSPRRAPGDRGRMTDGPPPSGIKSWPFPGWLEVELRR